MLDMIEAAPAFPLSFAQQRLWFLDRMAPGSPFYNIPLIIPIKVAVDHRIVQRVLSALVERHETLRTTFTTIDGKPMQIIGAPYTVQVPTIDLRTLPAAQRHDRSVDLASLEAAKPFDLERDPMIRATLVRTGPADSLLLLTLHHIVADGWSMGILARELTALYQAFVLNQPNPLPELTIQYA